MTDQDFTAGSIRVSTEALLTECRTRLTEALKEHERRHMLVRQAWIDNLPAAEGTKPEDVDNSFEEDLEELQATWELKLWNAKTQARREYTELSRRFDVYRDDTSLCRVQNDLLKKDMRLHRAVGVLFGLGFIAMVAIVIFAR